MKINVPDNICRDVLTIKAQIECSKASPLPRGNCGSAVSISNEAVVPEDLRKMSYKTDFVFLWWGVSARGFFFDFAKSRSTASRALNNWLKYEHQQIN